MDLPITEIPAAQMMEQKPVKEPEKKISPIVTIGLVIIILALGVGGVLVYRKTGQSTVNIVPNFSNPSPTSIPESLSNKPWIRIVNSELKLSYEIPPDIESIYERIGEYYSYSRGIGGAAWLTIFITKSESDLITTWKNSGKTYVQKDQISSLEADKYFTFTQTQILNKSALNITPGEKFEGQEGWRETVVNLDSNKSIIIVTKYFPGDEDNKISDQILSTFKFTDSIQTSDLNKWQTFKNTDQGFSIDYPGSWKAVTDKNYFFGNGWEDDYPTYALELQGKLDPTEGAPSLGMPTGYSEQYKKEGIYSLNPQLVRLEVTKNSGNLKLVDFIHQVGFGEKYDAKPYKVSDLTFTQVKFTTGIYLFTDYYIVKGDYFYRLSTQDNASDKFDYPKILSTFKFTN